MSFIPQKTDFEIVKQPIRKTYSKIELLNKSFKTTGQLEGEVISDSYSFDADSDIRQTYQVTMLVKDASFTVGADKKIWIDKYIRVSIGLYSDKLKKTVWYSQGIYILKSAGYSYNPTTKELSLSCSDRMAELTGSRNGQISGFSTKITSNPKTKISDAMRDIITQIGGIPQYRITDLNEDVPYDLEYGTGTNVYDVVRELRDLHVGYETFFDDEYFICQRYPTYETDPIVLNEDILAPLVISENMDVNFEEIKNVSEVWGTAYETEHYTAAVTFTNDVYTANYDGKIIALSDGDVLGFMASANNTAGAKFKADALNEIPILCEGNKPIPANKISSGSAYVLKYMVSGAEKYFYFCGLYQICGVSKLVSREPTQAEKDAQTLNEPTKNISWTVLADSPFCCDLPDVGEIRQIYSGGEFDNIYSDELALQRAEYETWKSTDLRDTISLEMIEVPWLKVNQKIRYRSCTTDKVETYLVKQKSGSSTGGIMTLSCVKFQPYYPWNI
ncbi:MAG: DUF5048 domain-containing protein [Bacteroides sp.]